MQLLIIRHGRAEDREEFEATGAPDEKRPLTAEGSERMRRAAIGLHRIVSTIDVLATSPLVRTQETAAIVASEFGLTEIVEVDALREGSAHAGLIEWLGGIADADRIAVVGHNNHLRELVGWLLTGRPDAFIEMKKGAAVLLELKGLSATPTRPESASLLWSLRPGHLRALAG